MTIWLFLEFRRVWPFLENKFGKDQICAKILGDDRTGYSDALHEWKILVFALRVLFVKL
jgi:hypothetical protein